MTGFADRATVNRLRIRCSGLDPLLARLRAGRLLDESVIQPATLPPSAILCIRRLSDPRPGLIALDGAQPTSALWADALAASIRDMARGARRPGHGDVTPGAEAVLFIDRAEMLACLAADWCAGLLNARWWWRALLKDVGEARAVLRAWLESPAYIAAALDELACRRAATTFVARLADADTRALLDAVIVQHDMKRLAAPLEWFTRFKRSLPTTLTGGDGSAACAGADHDAQVGARLRAPWTERVPESQAQSLRVDQQCLLGIALMTRRAPTIVRAPRFAADVQRWLDFSSRNGFTGPGTSDPSSVAPRSEPTIECSALIERVQHNARPWPNRAKDVDPPPTSIAQTARVGAHTLKTRESRLHPAPAVHFRWEETQARSSRRRAISEPVARDLPPTHEASADRRSVGEGGQPRKVGPEGTAPHAGAIPRHGHMPADHADPAARVQEPSAVRPTVSISAERPSPSIDAPASSITQSHPTPPAAHELVSPSRAPTAASSRSYERSGTDQDQVIAVPLVPTESTARLPVPRIYPASIETDVGGVFYMLNAALRLGLYGDFTTPAQPGIDLSIWDFLTLAGRALTPGQFRRDPVWVLFADLAGRAPHEAPGATFDPPDVWRLPAEWLDAFPECVTWRWRECAGRLRVVHPAGFAIVDVPRAAEDVVEQVERELSTYRSATSFMTRRAGRSRGSASAPAACSRFSDMLLAARGESLVAFDGRGIPAGCVAPRSHTPGIPGRRALLQAGRAISPRSLGATPHFHNGLLAWWMGCVMPYVRARLARALGTSLPWRAGLLLCVQRSRVTTTPTHVDVFFSLAELPIEVRLSGLDRNPGWVPAADRVIAFHYD